MALMPKTIFIRVVGFTAVERHALNSVFRLSREDRSRSFVYEPYLDGSAVSADMALIDGASGAAAQELSDMRSNPEVGLIWVGTVTPAQAWRSFTRPLRWPDVLTAMDMFFEPKGSLDFDLASDTLPAQLDEANAAATRPAPLQGDTPLGIEHAALLVDPDPEARLYLRSLLSAMGMAQVDEAGSAGEAYALLGQRRYKMVCVDFGLIDHDPWAVIAQARDVPVRLITGLNLGLTTKLTAKLKGCIAMQKPLESNKLGVMLRKLW